MKWFDSFGKWGKDSGLACGACRLVIACERRGSGFYRFKRFHAHRPAASTPRLLPPPAQWRQPQQRTITLAVWRGHASPLSQQNGDRRASCPARRYDNGASQISRLSSYLSFFKRFKLLDAGRHLSKHLILLPLAFSRTISSHEAKAAFHV